MDEVKSGSAGGENTKPDPEQSTPVTSQTNSTVVPEKPKRKLPFAKILVAGIVILITVLAFGLIAYLVMGQNKPQENQVVKTQVKTPSPTPDPTAGWETYYSYCGYFINEPGTWTENKYFGTDSENECNYLTTPDYFVGVDNREGFYLHITRTKLGSLGGVKEKFPINTLEDFIKDEESISDPAAPVNQKTEAKYGDYSGISYIGVGYEPGRSFIFLHDGYIYKVNWPEKPGRLRMT